MFSIRKLSWFLLLLPALGGDAPFPVQDVDLQNNNEHTGVALFVREPDQPVNPPHASYDSRDVSNVLSGLQVAVMPLMFNPTTVVAGVAASMLFTAGQIIHAVFSHKEMERMKLRVAHFQLEQQRRHSQELQEQLYHEQWRHGNESIHNWWKTLGPVQKLNQELYYKCMNETGKRIKRSQPELHPECVIVRRSIDAHYPSWTEQKKSEHMLKLCGRGEPHPENAEEPESSPSCDLWDALQSQYPHKVPTDFQVVALRAEISRLKYNQQILGKAIMAIMTKLQHIVSELFQALAYIVDNVQWKNGTEPVQHGNWSGDPEMSAEFWNKNFTRKIYEIAVPPRRFNASLPFSDFLKDHNMTYEESDYAEPPWELLHKNKTDPYYDPKDWELNPKKYWTTVYCEDYHHPSGKVCRGKDHTVEDMSTETGMFEKSYRDKYWVCQLERVKNPALPSDSQYEPKAVWKYHSKNHHYGKGVVTVVCGRIDPNSGHLVPGPYTEVRPGKLPEDAVWDEAHTIEPTKTVVPAWSAASGQSKSIRSIDDGHGS